jgi:predicted membrane channel-forming protein YqfA (hemolysin III family)
MENSDLLALRDSTVIAILDVFGIAYFSLFTLQCLLFHFPVHNVDIGEFLAVLLFGIGVVTWCLLSLLYRIILVFGSTRASYWERLEFGGILLLIYTSTITYVTLEFSTRSTLQLGYICAISMLFVGHLVEVLVQPTGTSTTNLNSQYHCASLGLISLVPIIHSLAGSLGEPAPLTREFARVAVYNCLGALLYFLGPLERMGLSAGWHPSLYIMRLVLSFSTVMLAPNIVPLIH